MRWLDFARVAALLPVATLMACDQGVTGPEMPAVPPLAAQLEEPVAWFPGWSSSRERDLKRLLESEKARIAFEQELSAVVYDSLKLAWDSFLQSLEEEELEEEEMEEGNGSPWLMCDPLQYTADTKIIGPQGGDLSIGPHKLSIPRGALSQYTVVTAEQLVSTHIEIRLSPHGLSFLEQPTLVLSYKHCYVPRDYEYGVAYVGEGGQILEWPSSYNYERYGELYSWIWHFSKYKVALRGYVAAGG